MEREKNIEIKYYESILLFLLEYGCPVVGRGKDIL